MLLIKRFLSNLSTFRLHSACFLIPLLEAFNNMHFHSKQSFPPATPPPGSWAPPPIDSPGSWAPPPIDSSVPPFAPMLPLPPPPQTGGFPLVATTWSSSCPGPGAPGASLLAPDLPLPPPPGWLPPQPSFSNCGVSNAYGDFL